MMLVNEGGGAPSALVRRQCTIYAIPYNPVSVQYGEFVVVCEVTKDYLEFYN